MADPKQISDALYEELDKSGFLGIGGCDDDVVVEKLREAKGSMSEVKSYYSGDHAGASLENALYDKLNEKHLKTALPLFYEVPDPRTPSAAGVDDPEWASRLKEAFDHGLFGWATDEDQMMQVLRSVNQVLQMAELEALYKERYGDSLEEKLYSELSGDDLKAALRLFYTGFKETPQDSSVASSSSTTTDSQTSVQSSTSGDVDGTIVPDAKPTDFSEELKIVETLPLGAIIKRRALKTHTLVEIQAGDTRTQSTLILIRRQETPEKTAIRILYEMHNATIQDDFRDLRKKVVAHELTPEEYAKEKLNIEAGSVIVAAQAAIFVDVPYDFPSVEKIIREYLVLENGKPVRDSDGWYKYQKDYVYRNGKRIYQVEEMYDRVIQTIIDNGVTDEGKSVLDLYTEQGQSYWNSGN